MQRSGKDSTGTRQGTSLSPIKFTLENLQQELALHPNIHQLSYQVFIPYADDISTSTLNIDEPQDDGRQSLT